MIAPRRALRRSPLCRATRLHAPPRRSRMSSLQHMRGSMYSRAMAACAAFPRPLCSMFLATRRLKLRWGVSAAHVVHAACARCGRLCRRVITFCLGRRCLQRMLDCTLEGGFRRARRRAWLVLRFRFVGTVDLGGGGGWGYRGDVYARGGEVVKRGGLLFFFFFFC